MKSRSRQAAQATADWCAVHHLHFVSTLMERSTFVCTAEILAATGCNRSEAHAPSRTCQQAAVRSPCEVPHGAQGRFIAGRAAMTCQHDHSMLAKAHIQCIQYVYIIHRGARPGDSCKRHTMVVPSEPGRGCCSSDGAAGCRARTSSTCAMNQSPIALLHRLMMVARSPSAAACIGSACTM